MLVGVLWTATADAQPALYTGLLSGHVGVAAGGDVRGSSATFGAGMAVIGDTGIGAEVDLGHTRGFDGGRFDSSAITSLMINAIGMRPQSNIRPFVSAGVGLLRARTSFESGPPSTSRTDWGFNAGAGVLYMFHDAFGVRGDVRYFRYFQRHDDLPLLNGGFFDFWRTSVGVTFQWPIT